MHYDVQNLVREDPWSLRFMVCISGMNSTRSLKKWLWLYLQRVYQPKMLLLTLVNKLYALTHYFLNILCVKCTFFLWVSFYKLYADMIYFCWLFAVKCQHWCSWGGYISFSASPVWEGIASIYGAEESSLLTMSCIYRQFFRVSFPVFRFIYEWVHTVSFAFNLALVLVIPLSHFLGL